MYVLDNSKIHAWKMQQLDSKDPPGNYSNISLTKALLS